MLSDSQKFSFCQFCTCLQLSTAFHYSPMSKFNMNEPITDREFIFTTMSHKAHLDNYLWENHFPSYAEGCQMLNDAMKSLVDSKKYLIPGYLNKQAIDSVKLLLNSDRNNNERLVSFIDGFVPFIPDNKLRKQVVELLESATGRKVWI